MAKPKKPKNVTETVMSDKEPEREPEREIVREIVELELSTETLNRFVHTCESVGIEVDATIEALMESFCDQTLV